ncbi:MAG: HAD family phosphatase [Clostridia bacterium]|nr:HAD family phosphatase [Clostridia bacterium]
MIPKFKAAMFDMDGTILRTMRYWRLTTIELLIGRNIIPTPEQMARVFSSSSRALCAEILSEHGIHMDEREILRELEYYMHPHYLRDATAKPRVREYLEQLRRAGVRMCVGTAAPRESAKAALTRLGLIDYFDFILDQYELDMRKSNPEFFRIVAKRMDVDVQDMCVFEDALYSIRTAKALGCPVIAIEDRTQAHDKAEIMRLADHYICEYEELL